jgi:hypothetical protein
MSTNLRSVNISILANESNERAYSIAIAKLSGGMVQHDEDAVLTS